MIKNRRRLITVSLLCAAALLLDSGCSSLSTSRLAANLSNAMLNQTDPEIVRHGAPAYLLLLDSFIAENPNDRDLLYAGARLYGAYAGGLVKDPQRQKNLTQKAMDYATTGFCEAEPELCHDSHKPFEQFAATLAKSDEPDLEDLYLYGATWAGWIQAHSDDWNAVADLAKAESLLLRVVERDPGYEKGRAQLYLGVIRSQIPPALGGKPELGKQHFESAIDYSEGQDLMVKLEYARHYARLVFFFFLHDRLLNEVLQADPVQRGLTLSNIMAQQQAKSLIEEDYF
ncbi:MAG: TRAP transporter TatT component family protein [Candidatus Thiodiazotropha taylori]